MIINTKLFSKIRYLFSYKQSLVNATPSKYLTTRDALKHNNWLTPDPTHQKSLGTHLSNAEYLIHKIPVIYSNDAIVRCLGGTQNGAGHPQVYIQLNTRDGQPVSCKWCGLRYALRHHH